jgi:hypothetical protein
MVKKAKESKLREHHSQKSQGIQIEATQAERLLLSFTLISKFLKEISS